MPLKRSPSSCWQLCPISRHIYCPVASSHMLVGPTSLSHVTSATSQLTSSRLVGPSQLDQPDSPVQCALCKCAVILLRPTSHQRPLTSLHLTAATSWLTPSHTKPPRVPYPALHPPVELGSFSSAHCSSVLPRMAAAAAVEAVVAAAAGGAGGEVGRRDDPTPPSRGGGPLLDRSASPGPDRLDKHDRINRLSLAGL